MPPRCFFVAPSPRTLRLSRDVTGPIRADQTTESRLRLTNTTKRHMNLDVRDAYPSSTCRRRASECVYAAPQSYLHDARPEPARHPPSRLSHHSLVGSPASGSAPGESVRSSPCRCSRVQGASARAWRAHELEGTTPDDTAAREPSSTFCAPTSWATIRATLTGEPARSTELMVRQWSPNATAIFFVGSSDCGRALPSPARSPRRRSRSTRSRWDRAPRPIPPSKPPASRCTADRAGAKVHLIVLDSAVRHACPASEVKSRPWPITVTDTRPASTSPTGRRCIANGRADRVIPLAASLTKIPLAGMETEGFTDALASPGATATRCWLHRRPTQTKSERERAARTPSRCSLQPPPPRRRRGGTPTLAWPAR